MSVNRKDTVEGARPSPGRTLPVCTLHYEDGHTVNAHALHGKHVHVAVPEAFQEQKAVVGQLGALPNAPSNIRS